MKTTTPLVNAPLMAVVKDYPTIVEGQDSGGRGRGKVGGLVCFVIYRQLRARVRLCGTA